MKKLTLILLTALLSVGAWAETAVLATSTMDGQANGYVGPAGTSTTGNNVMLGKSEGIGTGWVLQCNNLGKGCNGSQTITVDEINYTSLKNSNGAKHTVKVPDGYVATSVTFYAVSNYTYDATNKTAKLSEFNGETCADEVADKDATPTAITKLLGYATSFTFTFSVTQVNYLVVVTYQEDVTKYTFGTTRDAADGQVTSNNYMLTPDCSDVTTSSLISTYGTLNTSYKFYNGTSTQLTFGANATESYRNLANSVTIKSQAGTDDGAENHNAYVAFDLTIAQNKRLNILSIASAVYPGEKSNYGFEYIVEDADGNQLYKSPSALNITNPQAANDYLDYSANVGAVSALRNLSGKVRVKFLWWCNSSSTVLILKDFNVTASVSDVSEEPEPEPESTWRDIRMDFTTESSFIREVTSVQWENFTTGIAVAEDGTISAVDANDGSSIGTLTGRYHSTQWGINIPEFTVDVEGPVRISFGSSYYDGLITIKKGAETITTFASNITGKLWSQANPDCVTYDYTGEATTLTISSNSYCPYIAVEHLDVDPEPEPEPQPEYPLSVTWNFRSNTDQDYFTNPFGIERTTGTVHSDTPNFDLYVDATNGKFSTNGRSDWAQFNGGTKLRVPVGSTNDYVKITTSGSQATIGGELVANGNEFTHRVYKSEAVQGYVEIVSLGGYLGKIQAILSGDGAQEDRQATLSYYDADGETILGTVVKTIGETVGTVAYEVDVPEGYENHGWVDVIANDIAATQVVVADMALYPYITMVENGRYVIPAGNGRQLYNTLRKTGDNTIFYLPNGTYDMGAACRTELKNGCELLGESRSGVTVVNHPAGPGIQATSTIRITGNNCYIQHLTLRCDVSYSTSSTHGVGVALEVNGDKSICYDVDLQCNQDTYYSNGSTDQRGYMKNCRIEGTVDYICGGGNIWFENTLLYNNQRYDGNSHSFNNSADVIVAPSTAEATVYGYVFNNCSIDGHNSQANNYNLARGWQNSPAATWLNTTCLIAPSIRGYASMTDGLKVRFHELNTHDNAGNPITGHNLTNCNYAAKSDAIYLENVGDYTYENVVMGSDNWYPEGIIAQHNPAASYTVTSTPNGYATFYAEVAVTLPENVVAYTGTIQAEALKLQPIGGNVVPAGTPVVLKKEGVSASENWELRVSAASDAFAGENDLRGTAVAKPAPAYCYVLGYDGAAYFGKYKENFTIKANRAYLVIPSTSAPVRIDFAPQVTTSVEENTVKTNAVKIIRNGQVLVIRENRTYTVFGNLVK